MKKMFGQRRNQYQQSYYQPPAPSRGAIVAARMGRFFGLLFILFVVVLAAMVFTRVSTDTLAMIMAMILVGVPLMAIIGALIIVLIRQNNRQQQTPQPMMSTYQQPPVIVVPQQALPTPQGWGVGPEYYGPAQSGFQWRSNGQPREWETIGDNGLAETD